MPQTQRRRKTRAPVLARSPSETLETLDLNADFIPLSDPVPTISTNSQSNVPPTRPSTPVASTAAPEDVVAEPAQSPVYSPAQLPNTSTPVNTPTGSATPAEAASPNSKQGPE
ncbi:hypothetical protein FRC12_011428, partial [Ceratobasidium sp. 428]